MNGKFTKSGSINGKFKMLNVENGVFISQDGEVVPVAEMIERAMEGSAFDLSVSFVYNNYFIILI